MSEEAQRETVAFLSDPKTHGGQPVETITTHASMIFMAGDRVLKLKRAVKYSYLDFSTPGLRRKCCEDEVALNRRTAPELYLGVSAIRRNADGNLTIDGTGTAVDWVVDMRRFPQEALFSRLADANALAPDLMRKLADNIAAFHRIAQITYDFGGPSGIEWVIRINEENLDAAGPPTITHIETKRLARESRAALRTLAGLLERRWQAGKVRHCH